MNYYFLDTNSFNNYLNGIDSNINYTSLKQDVNDKKAMLLITPYTLLEYFDKIISPSNIDEVINPLIGVDFWVYNLKRIMNGDFLYEYGIDFVFEYKLNSKDSFEEFRKKREELRESVVESLFPYMFNYASILSYLHLLMKHTINGELTVETQKVLHIHNQVISKNRDQLYAFYKTYRFGYENQFSDLLTSLVCQILSATEAHYLLDGRQYDKIEFNKLMFELYDIVCADYLANSFESLERSVRALSKGKIKKELVLKAIGLDKKSLMGECYSYLIDCGCASKDLFNDFIDLLNLNSVSFNHNQCCFVTEEKKWMQLAFISKNFAFDRTKDFCRAFANRAIYKFIK